MKKEKKKEKKIENADIVICEHCHKKITHSELVGISLVCSHCKKPISNQWSMLSVITSLDA